MEEEKYEMTTDHAITIYSIKKGEFIFFSVQAINF